MVVIYAFAWLSWLSSIVVAVDNHRTNRRAAGLIPTSMLGQCETSKQGSENRVLARLFPLACLHCRQKGSLAGATELTSNPTVSLG